jgi:hypothetical protein
VSVTSVVPATGVPPPPSPTESNVRKHRCAGILSRIGLWRLD